MPKKPKKIRVGTTAWLEQKARDKQRHNEEQGTNKNKQSKNYDSDDEAERRAADNRRRARFNEEQKQQKQQKINQPQSVCSERLKYLKMLGLLPANDTINDIKKAYRRMALLYHPDKNPLSSAEAKMKTINSAYEYLTS